MDHEDLDQVMNMTSKKWELKWQVAMFSMRINKFQKKTGRNYSVLQKKPVGFDLKLSVECFKCHKTGHFARECRTKEENRRRDGWNTGNREGRRTRNRDESITGKKEESRALVTVDGELQTRTGTDPVNTAKTSGTNYVSTARQNINKQTVLTSTALKVNTVKPSVKDENPTELLMNKGIIDSGCSPGNMTGETRLNLLTIKTLWWPLPLGWLPNENLNYYFKVPDKKQYVQLQFGELVTLGGLACLIAKAIQLMNSNFMALGGDSEIMMNLLKDWLEVHLAFLYFHNTSSFKNQRFAKAKELASPQQTAWVRLLKSVAGL
ncbi:ribonuclease H-like domain-containing protein [Tanacetum coccineum]